MTGNSSGDRGGETFRLINKKSRYHPLFFKGRKQLVFRGTTLVDAYIASALPGISCALYQLSSESGPIDNGRESRPSLRKIPLSRPLRGEIANAQAPPFTNRRLSEACVGVCKFPIIAIFDISA